MRNADNLTTNPVVVMKSGNLNFLEPSRPITVLIYTYIYIYHVLGILELHPILVIGLISRNSSANVSQGTQLHFVPDF